MELEMGSTNSPWRLSQVGMLPTVEDRDRVATAAQRDRRRVLGQPGILNRRASSARRAVA
jgi:hypothetical protein